MEEKVKKKTTFWLPPDIIDRMDGWLKADNCRSRTPARNALPHGMSVCFSLTQGPLSCRDTHIIVDLRSVCQQIFRIFFFYLEHAKTPSGFPDGVQSVEEPGL